MTTSEICFAIWGVCAGWIAASWFWHRIHVRQLYSLRDVGKKCMEQVAKTHMEVIKELQDEQLKLIQENTRLKNSGDDWKTE